MLGGAGNVARNLAALGAAARFVSVVGRDEAGREIAVLCNALGDCRHELVADGQRRTTIKTRFFAGGQQMLRADHETAQPIATRTETGVIRHAVDYLGEAKVVVLSDYRQGRPDRARRERGHRRRGRRRQDRRRRPQGRRLSALSRRACRHAQPQGAGRGLAHAGRQRRGDRARRGASHRDARSRRRAGDARRRRHDAHRARAARGAAPSADRGARGVRRLGRGRHGRRHHRGCARRRLLVGRGGAARQCRGRHRRRQVGHGGRPSRRARGGAAPPGSPDRRGQGRDRRAAARAHRRLAAARAQDRLHQWLLRSAAPGPCRTPVPGARGVATGSSSGSTATPRSGA